jgi:hypothetical protein
LAGNRYELWQKDAVIFGSDTDTLYRLTGQHLVTAFSKSL